MSMDYLDNEETMETPDFVAQKVPAEGYDCRNCWWSSTICAQGCRVSMPILGWFNEFRSRGAITEKVNPLSAQKS